ncbi:polysaccharide deacetylase family protein [Streptomyces sparsogenes]|uniref:Putative polysaccharide/chitin/xylan deacetylase n=1 Tax=Streptomyces sparsogenes DSM 40356 TaxID=1331668 RepID=A0A1R1SMJ9_9ACTN|nr:polysaccharide deacetylase family protein [Streptomyces sparsogenes]OMI39447.1 putative polysaccharide/chitin/xylan deacetylase [Streptomyces sparsogenes DSM 40356]
MMIKTGLSRCLVLVAAAALLAGCGDEDGAGTAVPSKPSMTSTSSKSSSDAADHAPGPSRESGPAPDARSASGSASGLPSPPVPPPDGYRRWGLDRPLEAAPPPRTKPSLVPPGAGAPAGPPIVDHVPTRDRVVFVTIDDGTEKDPAFVQEVRDLGLPITGFLTDEEVAGDYDYFGQLRRLGNGMQNHTLTHPRLAGMEYEGQAHQICGQQEILTRQFGTRPYLFRPPYGALDDDTVRAAAACGVRALVMWSAEMKAGGLEYASGDRLHSGDIILAHFRGPSQQNGLTMTDVMTSLVREIQAQGFAVARLEDYL